MFVSVQNREVWTHHLLVFPISDTEVKVLKAALSV